MLVNIVLAVAIRANRGILVPPCYSFAVDALLVLLFDIRMAFSACRRDVGFIRERLGIDAFPHLVVAMAIDAIRGVKIALQEI